jgi:quercetin dioxygenase-like cupin family protein
MSAFVDAHAIRPQRIWEGIVGRAVHGEYATLSLLELEPNTVVPEHSHPNEQLGICIEGSLVFRVADETREIGPGGTWRVLSDVPHSVTTGPDGAVLVEVFAPARSDWHALEHEEPSAPRWPAP